LRSISNIDEFSVHFDQYNLNLADEIKGFDPNHLFMNHMTFVGFIVSLSNSFLFEEEEGNGQDPQAVFVQKKPKGIEIIISTIEQHKQR